MSSFESDFKQRCSVNPYSHVVRGNYTPIVWSKAIDRIHRYGQVVNNKIPSPQILENLSAIIYPQSEIELTETPSDRQKYLEQEYLDAPPINRGILSSSSQLTEEVNKALQEKASYAGQRD